MPIPESSHGNWRAGTAILYILNAEEKSRGCCFGGYHRGNYEKMAEEYAKYFTEKPGGSNLEEKMD